MTSTHLKLPASIMQTLEVDQLMKKGFTLTRIFVLLLILFLIHGVNWIEFQIVTHDDIAKGLAESFGSGAIYESYQYIVPIALFIPVIIGVLLQKDMFVAVFVIAIIIGSIISCPHQFVIYDNPQPFYHEVFYYFLFGIGLGIIGQIIYRYTD